MKSFLDDPKRYDNKLQRQIYKKIQILTQVEHCTDLPSMEIEENEKVILEVSKILHIVCHHKNGMFL